MSGATAATLSEVLDDMAERRPEARAFTFRRFAQGRVDEEVVTYGELARRARVIDHHLRRDAEPGARALLVYPPSLEFVAAFFGCIRAGMIPVPSSPPRHGADDSRLEEIARDCTPRWLLTSTSLGSRVSRWWEQSGGERSPEVVFTDSLQGRRLEIPDPTPPQENPTAALQYTSGSTGSPRGVVLSHQNLLRNLELCKVGTGLTRPGSSVVSWLPMFHDMGLIYGVLAPIYCGVPALLLAPVDFVKRPLRWLRALSDDRGTHTTGPNFSLDLCAGKAKPEDDPNLDLRQVVFFNCGAEPVRSRTLAEFGRTFARSGLPVRSLCGGYGLAEYTLVVSVTTLDREPTVLAVDRPSMAEGRIVELGTYSLADVVDRPYEPRVATVVGCGGGLLDTEILIVDPATRRPIEEPGIGEIWVCGGSAASGYWGRPRETARTFRARLADGRGPFLRTGDLGFLRDGELFITGRLKELIIVDGRNHCPQDLESVAQRSHAAIEPHRSAAFSVDGDAGEVLVLACEIARRFKRPGSLASLVPEAVTSAVRERLAREHGIRPHDVVLLAPGRLPRTTSGKIRRRECRRAYLAGTLERIHR